MKKILSLVTAAALTTSAVPGITQLTNHINTNLVNNNQISNNQTNNKIATFVPNITANDSLWQQIMNKLPKNLQDGNQNYYKYYWFYHVMGLSHDVVTKINSIIHTGNISDITSILDEFIPGFGVALAAFAALLVLEWIAWNVTGCDQGSGVVIKAIGGGVPVAIVAVRAQ